MVKDSAKNNTSYIKLLSSAYLEFMGYDGDGTYMQAMQDRVYQN
jgi:hypothetical protein